MTLEENISQIKDKELHRVVFTAIIYNEKNQYLLTKRSEKKPFFPGKWLIPGGGLEVDDYIDREPTKDGQWYSVSEHALRREIREEVNLEIGDLKFLIDIAFIRNDGIPVLVLSYFAPYKSGEVKLNDESTEYAWVSVDDLGNYDLITGTDEEIKMVDKILKSKNK
ncbi:NUDIX domain-containing protein [Candidatus Nomurabacteria bacterium]|nr:NUDIX domain-containing protein [Candidatus Nomurabacteria bacterium]